MKKIVILTAAGAVIPWGAPSTNKITDKIRNDVEFVTKDDKPLGDYLYRRLCKIYHVGYRDINFEHIIDLVEQLYDYYISKERGSQPIFKSSISTIFDIKKDIKDMLGISDFSTIYKNTDCCFYSKNKKTSFLKGEINFFFKSVYEHFMKLIIEEIMKYSSAKSVNKYKNLNKNFRLFLDCFKDCKIRFYTTNYDRIPIKSSKLKFFDGFSFKGRRHNEFNRKDIISDNHRNSYFNLHGSIYFNVVRYKLSPEELARFYWVCTPNRVNKEGIKIKDRKDQMSRHLIASNILAGLYKPSRLLITPVFQFYQKFCRDCQEADLIFVIGYSYGDKHLNAALGDAVIINKPKIVDINVMKFLVNQQKNNVGHFSNQWRRYKSRLESIYRSDLPISLKGSSHWIEPTSKKQIKIFLGGFGEFLKKQSWSEILDRVQIND